MPVKQSVHVQQETRSVLTQEPHKQAAITQQLRQITPGPVLMQEPQKVAAIVQQPPQGIPSLVLAQEPQVSPIISQVHQTLTGSALQMPLE